jgi:cytochrome c556
MIRTVLTVVVMAIGVSAVVAQTDPIATRKGLMKKNNENDRNVRQMVRGEAPFDVAKVNQAFAQWADTARHLPNLFPDDSKTGQDTRALPKIWETRSEFDSKIAALAKAVADNTEKAKTLEGLQVAYPEVNKACDNCHETYRRPSQRQPAAPKQ